jgi:hypothetical protein
MKADNSIQEAIEILSALGLPRAQCNARSAICLRALLALPPSKSWREAKRPLLGIRAMLDFARHEYRKPYAENTRETFRRQTMHQFLQAQLVSYNPDQPNRPVNSPHAVYQATASLQLLVKTFGSSAWSKRLAHFRKQHVSLAEKYGHVRTMTMVPVRLPGGGEIQLSPGAHSQLIKAVIEEFAPRYVPGGRLLYAGDTGQKWAAYDDKAMRSLGVAIDAHGKMPDVVLYFPKKKWLLLVEAVTSHGPVDAKRHSELLALFHHSKAGLVFVTAFADRVTMKRYLGDIAWETEVWVADAPTHLIHFNGERFLGPY